MVRFTGLCLVALFWSALGGSAAVCYGDDGDAEVFIHVEICPVVSGRGCTIICVTPDAYETDRGARTLARFIAAVSDGEVGFDAALDRARKKFGTGRFHEVGNVTLEPHLCRNRGGTKEVLCDF